MMEELKQDSNIEEAISDINLNPGSFVIMYVSNYFRLL